MIRPVLLVALAALASMSVCHAGSRRLLLPCSRRRSRCR